MLRKNKFNSIRSETNFDFIKGEIITKYYEGDKLFATVTETLIGKDRAIVKRERVGDEFVIWDLVEYRDFAYINRFIVEKNTNVIKYEFKNTKYSYDWHYNDDEKGLNNVSYRYEKFFCKNLKDDKSDSISKSGEVYEYVSVKNEIEIRKLKIKKPESFRYMANEVYIIDSDYKEKLKEITVLETKKESLENVNFNINKIKKNLVNKEDFSNEYRY